MPAAPNRASLPGAPVASFVKPSIVKLVTVGSAGRLTSSLTPSNVAAGFASLVSAPRPPSPVPLT